MNLENEWLFGMEDCQVDEKHEDFIDEIYRDEYSNARDLGKTHEEASQYAKRMANWFGG